MVSSADRGLRERWYCEQSHGDTNKPTAFLLIIYRSDNLIHSSTISPHLILCFSVTGPVNKRWATLYTERTIRLKFFSSQMDTSDKVRWCSAGVRGPLEGRQVMPKWSASWVILLFYFCCTVVGSFNLFFFTFYFHIGVKEHDEKNYNFYLIRKREIILGKASAITERLRNIVL
jgi:hypothetical protein